MQRLRVATTAVLIFGVILLFGFPVVLIRRPPATAPKADLANYTILIAVYFVLLIIVFFAIMILAWKLWRLQTEELAEKQMENLKELIEGTLVDHDKKPGS